MKKRFLAITLSLALCMGLAVPAFAADEAEAKSVTTKNVTLSDVVVTDEYEVFPESFDFPEGFYNMGMIGFWQEETEEYGFSTFGSFLVPADATITLDLSEDKTATVTFYTLKEAEGASFTGYEATQTDSVEIDLSDSEEDAVTLTKADIEAKTDEAFDLLVCLVGDDANDEVYVMFAAEEETPVEPAPVFTDVEEGAYYTDAVKWAVAHEPVITNGTTETTFEPGTTCTQVQILTFLYRAAGEPESETELPVDIEGKNVDYAKGALCWAAEKGMIDETFDVAADCTRADAVSFIWQAFDKLEADKSEFKDVDAEAAYAAAVDWAVANGITNGTDMEAGEFSPDEICTRGQIVTFLHRAYVEEARLTVEK